MKNASERIGQLIGERYELRDVVGRGGQGVVYRAWDRWVGRVVALKVLASKAAREQQTFQRLMREQQALTLLKGTAAVELLDLCRGPAGELCLVMELLEGSDLDEHLYRVEQQGERLSLARIVEIIDPVVSTLGTAHAAGILHRDLKPANVFLLDGGGVRLLDFGMARLKKSAPLTAAGTVMGSPSFMAPEAWSGVSDLLDQRADVYALGVILFRLLAGQLPFEGDTLAQKFMATTTAELPSLRRLRPELPSEADAWVQTALARDREQRFANVQALWAAFQQTFRVRAPSARMSLWAAAQKAVRRVVAPALPLERAAPRLAARSEPSFMREALAKSAFRAATTPPDSSPSSEATLELADDELQPLRGAPPPPRPEKTQSMSDSDLILEGAPGDVRRGSG